MAEMLLPINVYSAYWPWELLAIIAKYCGAIISFILTLPLLTTLLSWYLAKKKKRNPKKRLG
jgi:hypothetical protein